MARAPALAQSQVGIAVRPQGLQVAKLLQDFRVCHFVFCFFFCMTIFYVQIANIYDYFVKRNVMEMEC